MNRFNIKDRVAIVTGGNGQLGTKYVIMLAKAGAHVAIFDVCDKLNDSLTKLNGVDGRVTLFRVDITKKSDIEQAMVSVTADMGCPDILINNAARDFPPDASAEENRSFEEYPLESWQKMLDVNLTGTMLCCQVIGGAMAKAGRGSIINVASTYGLVSPNQNIYAYREKKTDIPFVKPVSYTATKAGILGMTKWLATYYAPKGVRVNALAPGGVLNDQDETFVKNYERLTPLGRMAQPNEYNEAILFLASDASSYMTGAALVIDGGWTAW